jgi:hypothetical protein
MWKKTADITIRAVLLISVASFGVAPASASISLTSSDTRRDAPADALDQATILLAQRVDHEHQAAGHDSDLLSAEIPLSRTITRKIVLDLASIRGECSNYDQVYRIDCLRQGIDMVVASMPDGSEYREAKRILKRASSRLNRIVATYKDTSAPKLEVPANANPRFKKRRRYTAIKHEAVPKAMTEARAVITEAATALLRSSENSERRYAHYQEISVAVDSTKVLLRSS